MNIASNGRPIGYSGTGNVEFGTGPPASAIHPVAFAVKVRVTIVRVGSRDAQQNSNHAKGWPPYFHQENVVPGKAGFNIIVTVTVSPGVNPGPS